MSRAKWINNRQLGYWWAELLRLTEHCGHPNTAASSLLFLSAWMGPTKKSLFFVHEMAITKTSTPDFSNFSSKVWCHFTGHHHDQNWPLKIDILFFGRLKIASQRSCRQKTFFQCTKNAKQKQTCSTFVHCYTSCPASVQDLQQNSAYWGTLVHSWALTTSWQFAYSGLSTHTLTWNHIS